MQREHRSRRVDAAARGKIARLRFDGRHRNATEPCAEDVVQTGELRLVMRGNPQAAGHEKIDRSRRQVRVGKRFVDRLSVAVTRGGGMGHAVRVLAGAKTHELRVDLCAPRVCVLVFLEDQKPAALGRCGAVGVFVERTNGFVWRVVV